MKINENIHFNCKITRFIFIVIMLLSINPILAKSQPIIAANEYIKIIKLTINDRIDVVRQIALGNKYVLTKDVKAYELDNISYKYDMLFECTSGTKYGDFYPWISIEWLEHPVLYEEINIGFTSQSSCQILYYQYVELKNFINNYFGVNLKDDSGKTECSAIASMDKISFPKFLNSNIEVGSCSIIQLKPVFETFSVLRFDLKLYKKKI